MVVFVKPESHKIVVPCQIEKKYCKEAEADPVLYYIAPNIPRTYMQLPLQKRGSTQTLKKSHHITANMTRK